jgi:hypothetical protein
MVLVGAHGHFYALIMSAQHGVNLILALGVSERHSKSSYVSDVGRSYCGSATSKRIGNHHKCGAHMIKFKKYTSLDHQLQFL